ncbi:MAG TPA: methyltransferase [Bryobacteraceae bacterium]|nr:methyltransferase [Bryobacteraceae bacterium]
MTTSEATAVTPQRLMQMAWGYAPPLMIEAAIRNKVFDALNGGAKSAAEVASATGTSVRGLTILMNALTGLELLAKDTAGRYSLTPESATFLVSTKPTFLGGLLRHTSTQLVPKWLSLTDIVRSGKPARGVNEEETGSEFFEQFVEDIFPMSYPSAKLLAETLALPQAAKPVKVLDLAAGSGVWGIALAQSSPQVSVTAVDWPKVLPVTQNVVKRFGLSDRFQFVAGDLSTANFGTAYDVATLGHILHSEGKQSSTALLKKTFNALAPGGTIAIAEFLVDEERATSVMGLIFAVNMLVNTNDGDTFTFNEISGWLRDAGFTDMRSVDSPGPSPLILATKPK